MIKETLSFTVIKYSKQNKELNINKLITREFLPVKEEEQTYTTKTGVVKTTKSVRKRWFVTLECHKCKNVFTLLEKNLEKQMELPCERCRARIAAYNSFILKATTKHGDKFDYSLVTKDNYVNLFTPVEIICKIHGVFTQKPKDHTSKTNGKICCPECVQDFNKLHNKRSIESWKEELNAKAPHITFVSHGNSDSNTEKCVLNCKYHGEFNSTLAHIKANTYICRECARENNAFDVRLKRTDVKGKLYFIYIPHLKIWKIGVTTKTLEERFRNLPYTYEIVWEHEYPTVKEAYEKEFFFLKAYRQYRKFISPTNVLGKCKGSTELLTCVIPILRPSV